MNYSILAEESADEQAIRILADGVLGVTSDRLSSKAVLRRRSGGSGSVLGILKSVVCQLHFDPQVDGLVVVIDSDESALHAPAHETPGQADPQCRRCKLNDAAMQCLKGLTPRIQATPLKIAIGMAVPAIEAWLRLGVDAQISEAQWATLPRGGAGAFTKRNLKEAIYGTDRPGLDQETEVMQKEASRIVSSNLLPALEQAFPGGFGALARDLRRW